VRVRIVLYILSFRGFAALALCALTVRAAVRQSPNTDNKEDEWPSGHRPFSYSVIFVQERSRTSEKFMS